ncbi:MAG TPA: carboxypeptidase regulatory-like domain-containing protein, partial [Coriobacteriia bacterium]
GKSDLVNVGDLLVQVRDKETGAAISGAQVIVNRDGIMYVGNSSPSPGDWFFGALSSGVSSVTVTATGYVFNDSLLASVTIVPEILTRQVAEGYLPSTAVIRIIDTAGKKVASAKVILTPGRGKAITAGGDGEVTFTGLLPGEYDVSVSAPNRTESEAILTIDRGGQSVSLTVVLAEPTLPGSLAVKVRDGNGLNLDGASVAVSGPAPSAAPVVGSPMATVNGESVFNTLSPGDYRVVVSLSGFATVTATGTVPSNVAQSMTVTLTSSGGGGPTTGSLRIVVYDSRGDPLSGVSVRITYPNNTLVTRTTDSSGQILLANLTPGTYYVRPNRGTTTSYAVTAGQETLAQTTGSR